MKYDETIYEGCETDSDIECWSEGTSRIGAYDDHSWASVHNGSDGAQCHVTSSAELKCD